jgi:hypothetical protein
MVPSTQAYVTREVGDRSGQYRSMVVFLWHGFAYRGGLYQRGASDEAEWTSWERWFQGVVVDSWLFPALWDRERDYYTPRYCEYVDRQLAAVIAAREASAVPTPPSDLFALAAAGASQGPTETPSATCAAQPPTEVDVRR